MPDTTTILDTPLMALHNHAGAHIGVWFGCALPDDFGDWRREYAFASETVALLDKNYRAYLSLTGPDRVRYLNAVLTNDIKSLAQNHGTVSLLLNPQGHILAEMETYASPESLFAISYAMIRERLIETLDKYIIMDDVTLTDETERHATLALEGPLAQRLARDLTGIDLNALVDLETRTCTIGAIPCTLVRRTPGKMPSAEFLTDRSSVAHLWQFLCEQVSARNGGPVGYTALSALRLEQGVPWFGYDFGEKQSPHEAGLQDSHISYTQGCYTGQEIVERVRSRGQVNRRRVDLVFNGSEVPAGGEILTVDGKEAGYVTRAAVSPALGIIGMGYARKESNSIGSELQWRGGTVRVTKFPVLTGTQATLS